MNNWLDEEIFHIEIGDKRLNKRLELLVEQFSQMPCSSIPEACGSRASTKAAYRFFDSKRVELVAVQRSFYEATRERVAQHRMVFVAQDTTGLDFSSHQNTKGMGYLDNGLCQGLKVHSSFAISPDGVPLGLVDQQFIVRDHHQYGKRKKRWQKATHEKESQRWLTAVSHSEERIGTSTNIITIADREADIYDLFAQKRRAGHELLVRAAHNRCTTGEPKLLFDKLLKAPIAGYAEISIRRARDRAPRQARVEIRFLRVEISAPRRRAHEQLPAIALSVILVEEVAAPAGVKPVRWLLLTSLVVTSFEEAFQCVKWYSMRWLIERYHYVLKSGCQVEELQLEEAERIKRAVAVYCIVAWRLLYLTYLARVEPETSSAHILEAHEWEALHCFVHKTANPVTTAPTVRETVSMIASLGGFLGRKSDGNPGVKVLWRGWRRLNDIAQSYIIFKKDVGNA